MGLAHSLSMITGTGPEKPAVSTPTSPAGRAGLQWVLAFNAVSAATAVYLGQALRAIHPIVLWVVGFGGGTLIFLLVRALSRQPGAPISNRSLLHLAGLNLTTALGWSAYLYALRHLEASMVSAIACAAGPMLTLLFHPGDRALARSLARRAAVLGSAAGGAFLVAFAIWRGTSNAELVLLGVVFALLTGAGVVGNTIFSKKLDRAGWTPASIMSGRFLLLVTAGMLYLVSSDLSIEWSPRLIAASAALGLGGLVAPLYLLQVGIERSRPLVVALLLATLPLFVLLFERIALGHTPPWPYLAGVGVVAAAAALGTLGPASR